MPVQKIKREKVQLSLPVVAYNSVKILAKRENKTVNNYVQTLVEREIVKNNLPLYCLADID